MLSAAHRREWWSRLISQTNANQESGRMMKRCSCLGHRQLLVQKGNGFNLPEYGYFHWLHSVLYYNGSWITICATYGVKNALLSIEEAPENQFVLVDMCIVKGTVSVQASLAVWGVFKTPCRDSYYIFLHIKAVSSCMALWADIKWQSGADNNILFLSAVRAQTEISICNIAY